MTVGQEDSTGRAGLWGRARPLLGRIAASALVYEACWKLATLFLLGPLGTAILNGSIALTRGGAVANEELVGFVLSPTGALTLVGFVVVAVAIRFFELAGLVVLAVSASRGEPTPLRAAAMLAIKELPRIVGIAAIEVAAGAVVVAPFAALAALTYRLMLGGTDINFYLATRPPRFLAASAIVGLLAVGAASAQAWLAIRWIFAVPASLFGRQSPRASLVASAASVRGRAWRVFGLVVAWQAAAFAASLALAIGLDFLGGAAIEALGTSNRTLVLGGVAFLMVVVGGVFALAAMAETIGFGVLVALLYEEAHLDPGARPAPAVLADRPARARFRRRLAEILAVAAVVALATAGQAVLVVRRFSDRHPVAVTAHRAGPGPAPENSLSALREGIAAGADFAEIDVQKTRDGVIVVVHDRDLARLAGVPRTVASMTLAEIKALDVGARSGPEFAGERVATLDEFIAEAAGKIGLNIELKYYGPDPSLAPDVVALLRSRGFTRRAVLTSLDPRGLAEARLADPSIPLGLIVSARVGDVTRLDLDFLSLNHALVTPNLVQQARRRGLKIHAWTIDDRALAVTMIDRGADVLITDDPAMARRVVAWRAGLSDLDLVLLRFRDWLGSSTFRRFVALAEEPEASR